MIKTKVAFLEGRLFSSQSDPFKNFSNCSDYLDSEMIVKIQHFQLSKNK